MKMSLGSRIAHEVDRHLTALSVQVDQKVKSLPEGEKESFLIALLEALASAWNKALPQRPTSSRSLRRHLGGNFYEWAQEPGKTLRLLFHDMNHMFISESFERFIPTISSEDGSRSFHTYIHEAANAFLEYGAGSPRIDSFVDMATKVISNQAGEWLKKRRGPDWDTKLSPEEFTDTCLEVLEKEVRDYHITAGNDPFMAGMVSIFRKILISWGQSTGILSVGRQTATMTNAVVPLLKKAVNALAEKHSETRVDLDTYQEYLTSLSQNIKKVTAPGYRVAGN